MVNVLVTRVSDIRKKLTLQAATDQLRTVFQLPPDNPPVANAFPSAIGRLMCQYLLSEQRISEDAWKTLHRSGYGKWQLQSSRLDFNISHSGDVVVAALTNQGRVGIDVEEMRTVNWVSFEDCFLPNEWAILSQATDPQKAFFELWTKKESLAKAYGYGLQIPLNTIEISENIGKIQNTLMTGSFHPLIIPGYIACVCVSDEQEITVENFEMLMK